MTLADLVKRRRGDRGMTVRDVEAAGGPNKSSVSAIETGIATDPRVSDILALAKALKLKPEALFVAAVNTVRSQT